LVLEQFDEEGEKPLIDPGVPSLTASQSFEGWKIDDEHKNLDINGLNAYICENYGSMTEDKTLKVYAMVFEVRYIVYHDQAGAVLRTQAYHVELSGGSAVPTSVEIDLPYVPFKGSQNFAGWVLEDKMEVAGDYPLYAEDLGTIYKNETNYTLSETLQLYPYLNSGFWLVFDTYKDQDADETSTSFVAPVFVEEGENTSAPTPPTRTGYRFDGWYKDKNLTERFIFGSPINEKTTVYAKWTAQTAKYTVVFWQQRNTDTPTTPDAEKEYDFYDSQIRTAHTGATVSIDTANSGETADNRLGYNSASSIGRMGYYFVYNEANTDTAPVVVKGDGSTVLNVYYDRKVITYRFFESNKTTPWTPSGGYVDAANGDYYYYTAKESAYYLIGTGPNASYRPASGDTIYYMYNVNANYYPTIDEADAYFRANYPTLATTADVNTETYSTAYDMRFASSGSLYEYYRFSSNSYYSWIAYYYLFNETYSSGYYAVGTGPDPTAVGTHNLVGGAGENVISGLYGAAVTNWPNPGDGYLWANDDAGQSYNYPLGMMEFVPALQEPSTEVKFYLYTDSGTKIPIYYVGQELGGTNYTVLLTSGYTTASTSNNTRSWYPNETVYGYTVVGYRFGTSGAWTPATPATEIQLPTTNANALYIAFARNTHKFVFYSNNEEVTPEGLPAGTDLNAIPFGASFAPFQRLVPTNGPEGYYFDGWYADPSCGTPFDFSATMPDSNVRVYAKWTQIRFRMVCDPRGGDESINPADIVIPNGQATTFCVNYGETVGGSNLNNATREGHTLLGWYLDTDPDNDTVFDTPFDFATPITTENIHA
ncbi:MAG: InlB B-repeat-containing protein, partial [Bacteroidales bacterium]|nr:InlB B-repeat-containing protein [Bacteroidales bacterium]